MMPDKEEIQETVEVKKPQEIFKADRLSTRLIPLNTYLFAFMRKNNLRGHHAPGLRAFAKNRQSATREEWDEIFSTYSQ